MLSCKTPEGFRALSVITLALTLVVVLWGAFTRLSGSGDGCGPSWPLCHGVILPRSPAIETLVEFIHRLSSGLVMLLSLWMLLSARRIYPRLHPARIAAWTSAMFMLIEAMLGAILVLYGWVDQSIAYERVVVLGLHLINTFFLIATIALACFYARYPLSVVVNWPRRERPWLAIGLILLSAAGVFGVIAALASMMHPAESFFQGVRADFSEASPWIVRIRILHPFLSVAASIFLIWYALREQATIRGRAAARIVIGLVALQMVLGPLALIVGASVPLKLLHLLVADLLVISFVILWTTRSQEVQGVPIPEGVRVNGASAVNQEHLAWG